MDSHPPDDPSHQEGDSAVACTNDALNDLTIANSNNLLASLCSIARRSSLDLRLSPIPSQQPSGQIWRSDFGHTLDRDFPPEERLLAINANPPRQPRVYKPVRVRTHATCHMCNTRFRGSPLCPQCQHHRCARCPKALPRGVQALIDQTKKEILTIASNYQQRPTIAFTPASFRPGNGLLDALTLPSTPVHLLPETAREYCDYKLTPLQHASALSSREVNLTFEQIVARYEKSTLIGRGKARKHFPITFDMLASTSRQAPPPRVYRPPAIRMRDQCEVCTEETSSDEDDMHLSDMDSEQGDE